MSQKLQACVVVYGEHLMEKKHKQEPQSPFELGMETDITVSALASDGRGLGRTEEGAVLFLEGALPGQRVRAMVDKVHARLAEGRVVSVLEPGPHEREAPCPHADSCGGCPWQKLPYNVQLEWKQRVFYDALRRVGKLNPEELPIVAAPAEWEYRNKMAFVFGEADGQVVLGQRGRRSHTVTDLRECRLQDGLTMRVLEAVRGLVREADIKIPATRGGWRHLVVRRPRAGGLGVEIIVGPNGSRLDGAAMLATLTRTVPEITTFALTLRTAESDVAAGEKILFSAGEKLFEILNRPDGSQLKLEFDHTSFMQVNTGAAEHLYAEALAALAPESNARLWDIYCGIGSIGLFMGPYIAEICGMETVTGAVRMAKSNATLAGISARYAAGDAGSVLMNPKQMTAQYGRSIMPETDLAVVDPPRAGLSRAALIGLLRLKPKKLLYVSCDPATLGRDAQTLSKEYTLLMARPVDLFPQTPHVEGLTLWVPKTA